MVSQDLSLCDTVDVAVKIVEGPGRRRAAVIAGMVSTVIAIAIVLFHGF